MMIADQKKKKTRSFFNVFHALKTNQINYQQQIFDLIFIKVSVESFVLYLCTW